MAKKEIDYYRLNIRIPCKSGGCWGEVYLTGKDLEIAQTNLRQSYIQPDSDKEMISKLEKISKKEFEKGKKRKKPSEWFG